jgi:hypothetical protein
MAMLDVTKLPGLHLRTRQTAGQRRITVAPLAGPLRITAADRTAAHPPRLVMIGGRTDARRRLMAEDRTAARRRLRPLVVAAEAPTDARCPLMVEVVAVAAQYRLTAEASEAAGERPPMVAVAAAGPPEASAAAADMPQLRATALVVVAPHTEATVTKLYL